MINGRRGIPIEGGLFYPAPNGGKITRRMVIQVTDATDDHAGIHVSKPSVEKAPNARTRDNHFQVGHDKSLGGEHAGHSIWGGG